MESFASSDNQMDSIIEDLTSLISQRFAFFLLSLSNHYCWCFAFKRKLSAKKKD